MDNNSKKGFLKSIKSIFSNLKKNEVAPIDFNRYTNIEDMYGYIGFIDKDGGFYRVRRIGSQDCGHGEWAYYFLDSYKKEFGISPSMKLMDNVDILTENPKFHMVFLYEDEQSLIGDNSHIASFCSPTIKDMTLSQKKVVSHLLEYQNKKADFSSNNEDSVGGIKR